MFPPHSVVPCLLFGTALSHAAQLLCPSPQDVWKAILYSSKINKCTLLLLIVRDKTSGEDGCGVCSN